MQTLALSLDMKNVMFHANDELQHSVYWSVLGNCWQVENINGHVEHGNRYHLCDALTMMHYRTARGGKDHYRDALVNNWTMTENPYA